jgi:SnoaL-like protein
MEPSGSVHPVLTKEVPWRSCRWRNCQPSRRSPSCSTGYCRGIDRLDWDLVRSCYHDDAFDDHGLVRGGVDEFVAFFTEMLTPMIATTHMLGNILITLDGDVAGCESQSLAWHRIPADEETPVRDLTAQGRYVDRIERRRRVEDRSPHRRVRLDPHRTGRRGVPSRA